MELFGCPTPRALRVGFFAGSPLLKLLLVTKINQQKSLTQKKKNQCHPILLLLSTPPLIWFSLDRKSVLYTHKSVFSNSFIRSTGHKEKEKGERTKGNFIPDFFFGKRMEISASLPAIKSDLVNQGKKKKNLKKKIQQLENWGSFNLFTFPAASS